jgi:hypothetical protein
MLSFLKNHPFAVEAFFESSIVFTFAVPKEQIGHLIPECLELDLFGDKWAFIAVAMVQTRSLRPKGFPKILGNDFFLIGYRVFVRFTNQEGKKRRGLYILKSETDKRKMAFLGNIFTHYNYATTDIRQVRQSDTLEISSAKSDFQVRIESPGGDDSRGGSSGRDGSGGGSSGRDGSGGDSPGGDQILLPAGSPFPDWKEARKFAGPLPFTFTYNPSDERVLIIEGVRENWKPLPVRVIEHRFSFIDNLRLDGARLANAFIIRDIPYCWKKGKLERWK